MILERIPRAGEGITVKRLLDKLNRKLGEKISRRTLERNLELLSGVFPIYCDETRKPCRWLWVQGASKTLPALSVGEAMALSIIEQHLRPLLPPALLQVLEQRFAEAKNMLEWSEVSENNIALINRVYCKANTLQLKPPKVSEGVLEAVQTALKKRRQLIVRHHSLGEEEKEKRLHPQALIQSGPVTYLLAVMQGHSNPVQLAMHRISQAKVSHDEAELMNKQEIDDYLEGEALLFGSGETISLVAYLSDDLCNILRETPLSDDQQIIEAAEDEYATVKATVKNSWQLEWWILSQGDDIEIAEPVALREKIIERLKDALYQYEEEDK